MAADDKQLVNDLKKWDEDELQHAATQVAEVVKQDIHVGDGGELIYRTKIQLSFKYESHA